MSAGVKVCSICGERKREAAYSMKQWMAKAHARKCAACVGEGSNVLGEQRECTEPAVVAKRALPAGFADVWLYVCMCVASVCVFVSLYFMWGW